MKLSLWYPAKPFRVTQAWGIYNPAYKQFGFSYHNGVDFEVDTDAILNCPVKAMVEQIDNYPTGAGIFVRLVTTDKWLVEGTECYVGLVFMHLKEPLCKLGDILEIGAEIGIADNTGFSTGSHTHMTGYRLKEPKNLKKNRLDTNTEYDCTFDPSKYFNGFYAVDKNTVLGLYAQVLDLLRQLRGKL